MRKEAAVEIPTQFHSYNGCKVALARLQKFLQQNKGMGDQRVCTGQERKV